MTDIEKLTEKRIQFLLRLYEISGGDRFEYGNMFQIGEELSLSRQETKTVAQYLEGEYLIEFTAMGGTIGITQPGIVKAEEILSAATDLPPEGGRQKIDTSPANPRSLFVIHGRNEHARQSLFLFLRSIGLDPREWTQLIDDTGTASPYIGEVLDTAFSSAQAVVVLMTPDDEARLKKPFLKADDPTYERDLCGQARPNVLFEAGMAFGGHSNRTVVVQLGELKPFSDIAGRHVIRMDNTVKKRQELAQRLKTAGCGVDLTGTDWHEAGSFDLIGNDTYNEEMAGQIDLDTLEKYLAKTYPDRHHATPIKDVLTLLEELRRSGYATIDELDHDLKRTQQAVAAVEKAVFENELGGFHSVGIVRNSLSIINDEYDRNRITSLLKRYINRIDFRHLVQPE
ncbi:MAG: nucleotide-binding protein [Thermodesulfobacteriota bacterium]|nr:nucleotide-binding protein [Thermodesulfobacteriota bacterium]